MNILLTNDDGIQAVGLRAIYHALVEAGHNVRVVAPVTEQSAVGHSLTVFMPLRVKEFKENGFRGLGVHGTPTDCVKLALSQLLPEEPDLVVSGINAGANVGPDIIYSGTVAAATEAAHLGCKAIALSYDSFMPDSIMDQARHAASLIPKIDFSKIPSRCPLNINYPARPMSETKGPVLCPQTTALWKDEYVERQDPRHNKYWWITGRIPAENVEENSDRGLLSLGYITVTPLKFEFTAYDVMENLKGCF